MSKDVKAESKPVEQAPAPVTLDQNIMAAIQATVQAAVKVAVGTIVEQLKPETLPRTPAPSIPVVNAGAPRPNVPPAAKEYTSKLQGIPVQPGEDLRHVHPHVIQDWFNKVESRWKENFNKRKIGDTPVNVSWTRG